MALSVLSVFIGVSSISLSALWSDGATQDIVLISRLPRTIALLLAGSAMAVAGIIMQLMTQNRFVEPSIAGTTQSASLGLVLMLVMAPGAPVIIKMTVASGFALVGTGLFMLLLRRVTLKSTLIVPLLGIMLSAIIGALTVFIALYFDLLQALGGWVNGDFSGILQGRYEVLWVVGFLAAGAYLFADHFTVAGMGRDFAVNVGLNYRNVLLLAMSLIAVISGVVVTVVGILPFLGLIVPNLISWIWGDHIRRTLPWIALSGATLVLICDMIGRLICYPFEIPASVILGVIGSAVFLFLLLKQPHYAKQ